uniref:Protein kinase domain-containing protein n=1 Tax=Magallana gigas TaxID=29159 RepID=A0A8W8KS36_MAGGI
MADAFSMGESIDDYQVLNLLGKGGFACVYRARSNKTGMEVAIKMIDKKLMKAHGMVARVRKRSGNSLQIKTSFYIRAVQLL